MSLIRREKPERFDWDNESEEEKRLWECGLSDCSCKELKNKPVKPLLEHFCPPFEFQIVLGEEDFVVDGQNNDYFRLECEEKDEEPCKKCEAMEKERELTALDAANSRIFEKQEQNLNKWQKIWNSILRFFMF